MSFSERDRLWDAIDNMSDGKFDAFKTECRLSHDWDRRKIKETIEQWANEPHSRHKLNLACLAAAVPSDAQWREIMDQHAIECATRQADAAELSAKSARESASSAKRANLISLLSAVAATVAVVVSLSQCSPSPTPPSTPPASSGDPDARP